MMEKVYSGYSIKNIPIPSERTSLLQLMEKVEVVITRMRWKAVHFNNNDSIDDNGEENTEWYGLKSPFEVNGGTETNTYYPIMTAIIAAVHRKWSRFLTTRGVLCFP